MKPPKIITTGKVVQRTDKCKHCGGPFPPKRPAEMLSRYILREKCGTKCQIEDARHRRNVNYWTKG